MDRPKIREGSYYRLTSEPRESGSSYPKGMIVKCISTEKKGRFLEFVRVSKVINKWLGNVTGTVYYDNYSYSQCEYEELSPEEESIYRMDE